MSVIDRNYQFLPGVTVGDGVARGLICGQVEGFYNNKQCQFLGVMWAKPHPAVRKLLGWIT